ncbi:MAG: AzlD domain-containing protein [Burkholderiales bacterium]
MSDLEIIITCVGLGIISVLTRGFFLVSQREWVLPTWVQKGLRYAPLAALAAVVAPEVLLTQGQLITTWQDARLFGAVAAVGYYLWRRGLLGTILVGMAVFLPLRVMWGW